MLLISVILFSCSDSTSPDSSSITVQSRMINAGVSITNNKSDSNIESVDAIEVTNIRLLLKRIMFHEKTKNDEESNLLKEGPFVAEGDFAENYFQLTTGTLPPGSYDKVKFEIHRFSSSEYSNYSNDPLLKDFATEDRYSVIIEGTVTEGSKKEYFVYYGTVTANLSLQFDPDLTIEKSSDTKVAIEIDATNLFYDKQNNLLDPRDPMNSNDIDNNVRDAVKYVKKILN